MLNAAAMAFWISVDIEALKLFLAFRSEAFVVSGVDLTMLNACH